MQFTFDEDSPLRNKVFLDCKQYTFNLCFDGKKFTISNKFEICYTDDKRVHMLIDRCSCDGQCWAYPDFEEVITEFNHQISKQLQTFYDVDGQEYKKVEEEFQKLTNVNVS